MTLKATRRFRLWGLLTVASVYLLILVGGVVRSTGSGMGCPDWPKCFGTWIPPTHVSQLPADYKEIYTAQRVAKNQKLARTLAKLGFQQVAGDIFAHPTQYVETDFNAVKTWIEYVNRLLGALIGVFVFLTVVFAGPYWRADRPVFWLALGAFLLTGVQGYLGSLVVSTNLLPIMVTIHMGLALVIVAMLLYAVDRARWGRAAGVAGAAAGLRDNWSEGQGQAFEPQAAWAADATGEADAALAAGVAWRAQAGTDPDGVTGRTKPPKTADTGLLVTLWLVLGLTFWQIVLGTQVREEIDMVAAAADYAGREGWVARLGSVFDVHRTFSVALLLGTLYVSYELWQLAVPRLRRLTLAVLAVLGLEVAAGLALAGLGLPAVVQPVHLTLATLLFGGQFLQLLAVRRLRRAAQTAVLAAARPVVA